MIVVLNASKPLKFTLTLYCAILDIPFLSATFFLTFIGAMWDGEWERPFAVDTGLEE